MVDEEMDARAKSFETGAAAYEQLRPEFPEGLFDDLIGAAGGRLGRGVLEIGAGTGRATLPLTRRGVRVEALEPSADMVGVLERRLVAENVRDLVKVRQARFEDVAVGEGPFGVVVAAQSFHWADPASRWPRLASVLAEDGLAFMFWNGWRLSPARHAAESIQALYERNAPGVTSDVEDHRGGVTWVEEEVTNEPALELAATATYRWERALAIGDYVGLLETTSQYAVAAAGTRRRLFDALRPALGDVVDLLGRTSLLTIRAAR